MTTYAPPVVQAPGFGVPPPPPAPVPQTQGLNLDAFHQLQAQTEAAGTRITPEQWAGIGGNPTEYYKLYGDPAPTLDGGIPPRALLDYTVGLDQNLNRLNESNPYGSSQYVRNPDGTYSRVSTLSPFEQQKQDQEWQLEWGRNDLARRMQNNLFNTLPQGLDGTVPARPDMDTFKQQRQDATDAYYNLATQDFDKNFAADRARMEQNMANRGIPVGSERWRNELDDFERRRQNAYADARDRSILGGRGEFESMFDRASANRAAAIDERSVPLRELAGVLSLNRGVNQPAFSPNYNVNVGGLTQGLGQLASQWEIAKMQDGTQRYLAELANQKKGGGGGGGIDPNQRFEQDLIKMIYGAALDAQNQPSGPSTGDLLLGIGGQAAGGFLGGLGQSMFSRGSGDAARLSSRKGAFSF